MEHPAQKAKKTYSPPTITDWGTIADLTKVGQTHPGTDIMDGSVNPPGHEVGGPPN